MAKMPMKKMPPKMTEAMDDAMDKKRGIKENGKRDVALDKKRGLPPFMKGKK